MRQRITWHGVVLVALVAMSCASGDNVTAPTPKTAPVLTTAVPFDMGAFHNEILARMRARMAFPASVSYEEFLQQLKHKANRSLDPYQPNREITDEDVALMMGAFHTFIEPYFDVTNRDPSRSDVTAVFANLLRLGRIDNAEYEQLVALSEEQEPELPASQTIVTALAIRGKSLAYWSAGRVDPPSLDDGPPTKDIRNHLADWVGGMIGVLIPGAGPILGATLAAGCSLYFVVEGGSVGTGGPSGGGGGGCSCCPNVGPPCE